MKDKEIMKGVLTLVGALAERQTGERLEIGIMDEHGNLTWFYTNPLS
jgi:hypothetical protein